jgi:hypothetical protein
MTTATDTKRLDGDVGRGVSREGERNFSKERVEWGAGKNAKNERHGKNGG